MCSDRPVKLTSDQPTITTGDLDCWVARSDSARAEPTLGQLVIDSPCDCRSPQPITVGIPFPHGILGQADRVALWDADGRAVAVQSEVLARWPE